MSLPLLPVFKRRDLVNKALTLPVQNDAWSVDRLSWQAIGGPDGATISTSGAPTALAQLLDLLRCPVEVYDDIARAVWWGLVHEVKLTVGDISIGVSLDKLANKVRVVYTKQTSGVNTGGGRGTTDWNPLPPATNDSIAEYGERQLSVSMSDVTFNQAEQARDDHLARYKTPRAIRGVGGGARRRKQPGQEEEEEIAHATIICKGWWYTLEWKYYSQFPSATSSENEPTTISKVGRSNYTSTGTITFADVGGVWQINDSANGLLYWEAGDYIVISGTTLNNIKTRVASAADDGSQLIVSDLIDNESPAGAVTIAPWSTKLAQSFQLTDYGESYWLHTVRIQAMMVGLPDVGSQLRVSIADDNAGEPGTILASAELVADTEIFDVMAWLDWTAWDSIILLAPNTTYWIIVERVDTADTDCYTVALDEEALYLGGKAMFWTGAAWEPFQNSAAVEVPADMPFVVIGAWITEKQIDELIAAAEFITSVTVENASNSYGFPYRNGDNTILYELKKALQGGVSGGRRYLAEVKLDRSLRVYEEPESAGVYDLQLTTDGRYLDHLGQEIEPYRLQAIVAHHVRLPQTILNVLNSARLVTQSPFFVESAEWTPSGGVRTTTPGEDGPWSGGTREG